MSERVEKRNRIFNYVRYIWNCSAGKLINYISLNVVYYKLLDIWLLFTRFFFLCIIYSFSLQYGRCVRYLSQELSRDASRLDFCIAYRLLLLLLMLLAVLFIMHRIKTVNRELKYCGENFLVVTTIQLLVMWCMYAASLLLVTTIKHTVSKSNARKIS